MILSVPTVYSSETVKVLTLSNGVIALGFRMNSGKEYYEVYLDSAQQELLRDVLEEVKP